VGMSITFCMELMVMTSTAVAVCWRRRQRLLRHHAKLALKGQEKSEGPGACEILWAMAVGASITIRLACSAELASFQPSNTLAASCWVSALGALLSVLCAMPFLPRRWRGENLEFSHCGALSLPVFLAVAVTEFLGLGLTQLILLVVTVLSGMVLDFQREEKIQGRQAMKAAAVLSCVCLLGAFVGVDLKLLGPVLALVIAGVSAVAQANLLATQQVETPEKERSHQFVCLLSALLVHVPLLMGCLFSGDAFQLPRLADAPLWAFLACQGIFFLQSVHPLAASLGNVATFTFALVGQILMSLASTQLQAGIPPRLISVSMLVMLFFLSQQQEGQPQEAQSKGKDLPEVCIQNVTNSPVDKNTQDVTFV